MLDDFNDLSKIIEADDPRFNEIWDEGKSVPKEEGPEEEVKSVLQPISILKNVAKPQSEIFVEDDLGEDFEPGLITVPNAPKSIPILKNGVKPNYEEVQGDDSGEEPGSITVTSAPKPILKKNAKPKRDKVTISMIHADNQSVISTISKSTFHSNSDSFGMMSVLMDTPVERQISEITPVFEISPVHISRTRSSENSLCSSGVFLNLYEPIGGYKSLKMISCANESTVLESPSQVVPLLSKGETQEESDGIRTDSSLAKLDKSKPLPPPGAEQDNNDNARRDGVPSQSTPKSGAYKVFLINSEPFASIPEFMASAASQFLSSSLSVDDEISNFSIYMEEANEDDNDVEELLKTRSDDAPTKVDIPNATLDDKRLDERNLLDSLSVVTPQALGRSGDSVDEENITTGLGLTLPPVSQRALKCFEAEDPNDITLETIEVDENGNIVIDEVDETDDSSTNIESHHQEASSSIRNVYMSYRIKPEHADDTVSFSNASNTSANTTKPNLALKSFKIRRWGKKMKIFSGNKDKSNNLSSKARNSLCDSPGGATVSTATTAMTQSTMYYGEFPMTRKSMPYLIRPCTKA